MRLLFLFPLIVSLVCGGACTNNKTTLTARNYEPREGDFIFQSLPHSPLINTIEGSTGSPWSHCGLVVNSGGTWKVLEAIGPVKKTELYEWIAQGRGSVCVAFRLNEPLLAKVPGIIAAAERYEGRPYDIHYDFDDAKIYCSELLWKATRDATGVELGKVQKLGDLDWKPWEQVIRGIEYGRLPLDREMITPRALTEDPRLTEVFRGKVE